MFIPGRAVMIPLVQPRTEAHLIGGIPGLMLDHVVNDIPICTLSFRNDHASWSVVLPNSAPAFAVTLSWQFTSLWNALFAVFPTGPTNWPTTVRLNNIAGSMVVPSSQQMAGALKGRLDQA
jgi:glucose/mannose transport system permease protein